MIEFDDCPFCGEHALTEFAYHWACLWCLKIVAKAEQTPVMGGLEERLE